MYTDTDSIPDEDLHDLGIDAPDEVYGLLDVWSFQESRRIGEVCLFESPGQWISLGRGAVSRGGDRRGKWLQQRPGEHTFMPPLETVTCSADQMLVKAVADG